MDIRRVSVDLSNKKFKYVSRKNNKVIKVVKTLKRINSLRIPPNYSRVRISSNKSSKVQAIGEDTKGRKQYIYHPEFIEEQQTIKFQDLINFGRKIKRIRKDYRTLLENSISLDSKNKLISMVLYLLDVCNFRVGTEEYKKRYNTYGATTLNTNHILFTEKGAEISFVGKKSIQNTSIIKQPTIIKLLDTLCERNRGKEYLFYYQDEKTGKVNNVNSSHMNTFLKKYHANLKPKMFRTWNGNAILLKYLLSQKKPNTLKEIKANLKEGIRRVSVGLHNTVTVAKKSYCNSEIYETYLNDNETFFEFIDSNRKDNGDKKSSDRMLTLFLIKYYKKQN